MMPVQFISHHYSNKLGNPGEKQVGMKRFFMDWTRCRRGNCLTDFIRWKPQESQPV